jgi:hypothetical protein
MIDLWGSSALSLLLSIVRDYNRPCLLRAKDLAYASTHRWVLVSLMLDSWDNSALSLILFVDLNDEEHLTLVDFGWAYGDLGC